jgi:hypothetical protein
VNNQLLGLFALVVPAMSGTFLWRGFRSGAIEWGPIDWPRANRATHPKRFWLCAIWHAAVMVLTFSVVFDLWVANV